MSMLGKVQSQLEHSSKSKRRIAEVILVSPDNAIHLGIAAMALEANASEPTVNCLYRGMDTRGFPDFKLHLVQSLANGTPYVNRNADEDDSIKSYTGEILESAMTTLDHIRHSLGRPVINHAVDLLTQAKKIAFFGLGSLIAIVHDTVSRLLRFNVPVVYSDDIMLQRMSCMNCSDGDVVALISHIGRAENLVELAQLTRENGAIMIALTPAGILLAREATLTITLDVPKDTDIYMSVVSRLAQPTVIDVLATGFTLRHGAKFGDNLKRVKKVLKESRFDKQLLNLSDDR